ncbi:MAG: winged helix-turn-helix domain-containing protein, partial [Myxococcota bacterium]
LRRRLNPGRTMVDEGLSFELDLQHSLWAEIAGERRPLTPGEVFTVGERTLSIISENVSATPTDLSGQLGLPYRLTCARAVRRVRVRDLRTQQQHLITARRRAMFMRALAERLRHDRHASRPPIHQGWCTDDEIGLSVWGERWLDNASNRLNVLIHRIRKELEEAGFDPACVQKRRGSVRLWLQQVEFNHADPS